MRRLFTTDEAMRRGVTMSALKWGEQAGRWRRIRTGVYGDGPAAPTQLDVATASVLARHAVAANRLAAVLHGFDGVGLGGPTTRRRRLPLDRIAALGGVPCTTAGQTLTDLASLLDDDTWEQALESALRKGLTSLAELDALLAESSAAHAHGTQRMRRVLALRPPGAPPTESLLETMMVQLARTVPSLPELLRQHVVYDRYGSFVARLDLSSPQIGLFLELDGQQHKIVYDARRETAVVAATGWLPGRFTWTEVVRLPVSTRRRLAALAEQARRRSGSLGGT